MPRGSTRRTREHEAIAATLRGELQVMAQPFINCKLSMNLCCLNGLTGSVLVVL